MIAKLLVLMYALIPNSEAIMQIKDHNGTKVKTFELNNSVAFKLDDGCYIIIPQIGDSSMFFPNENDYQKFLVNQDFPKNNEVLFSNYETQLSILQSDVSFFYKQLFFLLERDAMKFDSFDNIHKLFKIVNFKVKQNPELFKEIIVPIGIVLGDYLNRHERFIWRLDKEIFQFQTYTYPKIIDEYGVSFNLWKILMSYVDNKNFDAEDFKTRVKIFKETSDLNFKY